VKGDYLRGGFIHVKIRYFKSYMLYVSPYVLFLVNTIWLYAAMYTLRQITFIHEHSLLNL
jgi:hypothetical protein